MAVVKDREKCDNLKACVCPVNAAQDPTGRLTLAPVTPEELPLSGFTLGALGVATRVTGPDTFPAVILRQPFASASLTGINARTVRVFRVDPLACTFRPVWDSGINIALGFVWSRISRPGVYAPLGLPRDRLLFEMLRGLAPARWYCETQTPEEAQKLTKQYFGPILKAKKDEEIKELEEIRTFLTLLEIETCPGGFLKGELRLGRDGVPLPFPLPGGASLKDLQKQLAVVVKSSPSGLPEESLFFPPEKPDDAEPPWLILPPRPLPRPVPLPLPGEPLPMPWPPLELGLPEDRLQVSGGQLDRLSRVGFPEILSWLSPSNWWMHHRDPAHTGAVLCSAIRRTNVGTLVQRSKIDLHGAIVSMPCVVAGMVYIGTSTSTLPGESGALYRIELATGIEKARFAFSGDGDLRAPHAGVASSPAVVGDKVYFSALTGKIYCLDADSLACRWVTNLRNADLAHNQPVDHGNDVKANCWSSPLVVKNRVYVACGEGENAGFGTSFGFVYCLDAATGNVIWLFCTNQFDPESRKKNKPNVIPRASWPLPGKPPHPFKLAKKDPPFKGASPWSAPAYCAALDRIYIGTGNAVLDDPLPDPQYASGLLALDATTGDLKEFFQPLPADSYRETLDLDVDVPAGPAVFTREGTDYVCFGSKNGSFFILNAKTMKVAARRQLLPYSDDPVPKTPFSKIDPPETDPHENKWGVFGTAAVAAHLDCLFIGIGGYDGAIDHTTTPFIRAVNWKTLADAWPMEGENPPKYRCAEPPVYRAPMEAGMSSPAVVNDVVFVSTTTSALYAFDAKTGLCLWEAPGLTLGSGRYAFGPAIYGNFVVNGVAEGNWSGHLYIYSL